MSTVWNSWDTEKRRMGFYAVVGLTKLMYTTKSWTDSDCILRSISKVIITNVQLLNTARNLMLGWFQSYSILIQMNFEELNN